MFKFKLFLFRSVISYNTVQKPFYSTDLMSSSSKDFGLYDSLDSETLKCFQEYQLASLIFYGLKVNNLWLHSLPVILLVFSVPSFPIQVCCFIIPEKQTVITKISRLFIKPNLAMKYRHVLKIHNN